MPKYYVTFKIGVERIVLIEAENKEDAADLALAGKGETTDEYESDSTVEDIIDITEAE